MRRGVLCAAILPLLAACSTGAEPDHEGEVPGERPVVSRPAGLDSVAMPAFPAPRRGRLVAVSDGGFTLDGRWPARAGMCPEAAMLQLVAEGDSIGIIVVLQLPGSGELPGRYPVVPDSEETDAPRGKVGIQFFEGRGAFAFQAVGGEVVVERLDGRVSGRMQVTLSEVLRASEVAFAAVFDAIAVDSLSGEECRLADQPPPD